MVALMNGAGNVAPEPVNDAGPGVGAGVGVEVGAAVGVGVGATVGVGVVR